MWVSRRRRRYQELFNSAALATNALAQLDEVRAQLGELAGRVHDLEVERDERGSTPCTCIGDQP